MLFNFSWVIPNKLAGSNLPGRSLIMGRFVYLDMLKDLVELKEKGISVIASIIDVLPVDFRMNCEKNDLELFHYIVNDFDVPINIKSFELYVNLMIESINQGKAVLCHCHAGCGRTGLLLACIVGRLNNLNSEDAIILVRKTRPHSIENDKQIQFVQIFLDGKISQTNHRGVWNLKI